MFEIFIVFFNAKDSSMKYSSPQRLFNEIFFTTKDSLMKIFFTTKENVLQCKSFVILYKLFKELLFVEKYGHTVVVGIVMSVLLHF